MFTGTIRWQCGQDWGPVSFSSARQLHLETITVSFKWLWALRVGSTLPYSLPARQRAGASLPQPCWLPAKPLSWENAHTHQTTLQEGQKPDRTEVQSQFKSRPPALCKAFVSGNWCTFGVPPNDTATKSHYRHFCGFSFIATWRRTHTSPTPNPDRLPSFYASLRISLALGCGRRLLFAGFFPRGAHTINKLEKACTSKASSSTGPEMQLLINRSWNCVPGAFVPTNGSFSCKHATWLKGAHQGGRQTRKLTPKSPAPHPTPHTKGDDKVDKGKTIWNAL